MLRVDPILEARLARSMIERLRDIIDRQEMSLWVKTWCRVCGEHILIEMPGDYASAIDLCYELDDLVEWHHGHTECGGWGIHFRFDEMLELVFPEEHLEALWPKPDWYPHFSSEDLPVRIVEPTLCWSNE